MNISLDTIINSYRSWQWRWRHRAETKQCHPEHPFPELQFVHLNPRSQRVALQRHIETSFHTISKYFEIEKRIIKAPEDFTENGKIRIIRNCMNHAVLNLKYKIIERIVPSHNAHLNFVAMRD